VDPSRILLLTFTRRAAREMLRRVEADLDGWAAETDGVSPSGVARSVVGGTFHAVAARLLRQFGDSVGLAPDFTVLDRSDAEDLFHAVRSDLGLPKKNPKFPKKKTCAAIYGRVVNTGRKLTEIIEAEYPHLADDFDDLRALFQLYRQRKQTEQVLDYDDLLLYWDRLLNNAAAGDALRERFSHVLVDEYQDTNPLQAAILAGLTPTGRGLTVVGDDAQAIYAFRGATVRNILDFAEHYPGTTTVPLELNYRSRQPILDVANAVIAAAKERLEKTLVAKEPTGPKPVVVRCRDEAEQSTFVCDEVLRRVDEGLELADQCVLFRNAFHSLSLELELARRKIPFHKFGGLRFIETAHVKDVVAFLRLAENPRDGISARRVLTLIPGIGDRTAGGLLERLRQSEFDFTTWDAFNPPVASKDYWADFLPLMNELAGPAGVTMPVETQLGKVRAFYSRVIEFNRDDAASRRRDLEQLELVSARSPNRTQFLVDMTLDPPTSTRDLASRPEEDGVEDFLTLSTIHSAKGLEFDAVTVLHCADGSIPSEQSLNSDEQLDEERRLFYVAVTRAKTHLTLLHPLRVYDKRRGTNDAYGYAALTRFLPENLLPLVEQKSAGGEDALPARRLTATRANLTSAVDDRLDDLWG
ncbi:MAG: ATP-dependent helicase, partial [Planctomycetota bacterium]